MNATTAERSPAATPSKSQAGAFELRKHNHYFRRLDQGGGDLALLQSHFPDGIGGHDGCDVLIAHRQCDLSHEAADLYVQHSAHKLVAPADSSKILAPRFDGVAADRLGEETIDLRFWNSMVPALRLYCFQLSTIDPLLQRRVTDSEHLCRVSRRVQLRMLHVCRHSPKAPPSA